MLSFRHGVCEHVREREREGEGERERERVREGEREREKDGSCVSIKHFVCITTRAAFAHVTTLFS